MLQVNDRPSVHFQRGAFTVLLFHTVVFVALIHSCGGNSQVVGPSQPIVALVGDDIILPCHLDPVSDASDMTVEWARPDLSPRFVLLWRDGVELKVKKHPSYRGRTSLFTAELKHGNISMKLSNVKISDDGIYRCFIPELDRAPTVRLVAGAVSSPVIQVSKNSSAVVLKCESKGWYPEPEVLWLDGEGNLVSAEPTETLTGPDGLYNVSSRVTVSVEKRHSNSFTCRVHQRNINQSRETHVPLPDDYFMVPSPPSPPGNPHVVVGSVIGCAALVFLAALLFVLWKWRQKKSKNNRRSPEDGPEQTKDEETATCQSDHTRVQVVMEEQGENAPLMAGRRAENNVEDRGEEESKPPREHQDESHRDQLLTKPTEGETNQEQDETGRQVLHVGDEAEGEHTMKPGKEDSGLPLVLEAEGQTEQQQNVHTDQKVERRQGNEGNKKEAKIKKEKEEEKKKQEKQENQRKQRRQIEVERRRKLQSEVPKEKETKKDEIELKPQRGDVNQHDLDASKQAAQHEDKKGKVPEGIQRDITRTTGRKTENRTEGSKETKDEKVETERKLQSEEQERIELKPQQRDVNQHDLDSSKQAAQHEDKKGKVQDDNNTTTERKVENSKETKEEKNERRQEKIQRTKERIKLTTQQGVCIQTRDVSTDQEVNQWNVTAVRERKPENQKVQMNEKSKETEIKRDEPPSVSREVRPDVKRHQETAEKEEESHQEDEPPRSLGEPRDQPEDSTEEGQVECEEGREERTETDEGADIDGTQKTSKETENQLGQEGQQQAVQQVDVKEESREQIPFIFNAARGAECQEGLQREETRTDRRPKRKDKRSVKPYHLKKELNVDQKQTVRKKMPLEEDVVQTAQETLKKLKERLEGQNDVNMASVEPEEANMEQERRDEPEGMDLVCQEDQQEDMDQ